jgi:hypothetical protein
MTLVWRPGFQFDADASTYIEAVEAADTQALETGVRYAINDFVIGCKNDGIWDAIKASCILAGARTLSGALVPLVGAAPTNSNFVAGDYDRETGLKGGSPRSLKANVLLSNADKNNHHCSIFCTEAPTGNGAALGLFSFNFTGIYLAVNPARAFPDVFNTQGSFATSGSVGFIGASRQSSSQYLTRNSNITQIASVSSTDMNPENVSPSVFAWNIGSTDQAAQHSNARLAFYSIGESLDLAALDTRVSTLITAIGAAIP